MEGVLWFEGFTWISLGSRIKTRTRFFFEQGDLFT